MGSRLKGLLKEPDNAVGKAKRRIFCQAGITAASVLLIVVMIFGITAAWYSNVVQMRAITVQAEKWGFEGNITIPEEPVAAAPGESGVIEIQIDNSGEQPAGIRLDVVKDAPDNLMSRRFYCYTEDAEGSKTYLNSQNHYIFNTVNAKETVKSGDVRWQWVYDVLGYYVLGTVKAVPDPETGKETADCKIEEYLMPVEYDLDTARFDVSGELVSVTDAKGNDVPADEYIKTLYAAYLPSAEYVPESEATEEKPATQRIGNYYAVDVDAEGYGVWLCLLGREDIVSETETDTALADGTLLSEFTLTLKFTGQNIPN